MRKAPIDYDEYTQEELLEMSKREATKGLTEIQQRFCEYYVQNYNLKTSLAKAGYAMGSTSQGWTLRQNPKVQRYIQWIKARLLNETLIKGRDIIDQWSRIAFADLTDFVDIHRTSITLKPNDQIDGQLVKAIKSGRDGISIELYDKLKALDSLAKYTEDMPKDYRQVLDERKQQLLEEEFALKKAMQVSTKDDEDDGFLEAIKKAASVIWDSENH